MTCKLSLIAATTTQSYYVAEAPVQSIRKKHEHVKEKHEHVKEKHEHVKEKHEHVKEKHEHVKEKHEHVKRESKSLCGGEWEKYDAKKRKRLCHKTCAN